MDGKDETWTRREADLWRRWGEEAVDRFDPSLGTPFLGELPPHFRDKVWMGRAPGYVHDLLLRVERASEDLTLETGRAPTVAAIAARLEVEPSDVLEALEFRRGRRGPGRPARRHADGRGA